MFFRADSSQFVKSDIPSPSFVRELKKSVIPFLGTLQWEEWKKVQEEGVHYARSFNHLIVIGIGGSSLGGRSLISALRPESRVLFLENPDSDVVQQVLRQVDPRRTLFQVVSKSGVTLETMTHFFYLWELVEKAGGQPARQFVVTTDPEKGFLRKFANAQGLQTYSIPSSLGGRFSVFSPVGLFPAAFSGISLVQLYEGAETALQQWESDPSDFLKYAQAIYGLAESGKNMIILFPYQRRLVPLAQWMAQLIGESLGKKRGEARVGMTPLVRLGPADQHSQLQLYLDGPRDKWAQFLWLEREDVLMLTKQTAHFGAEWDFLSGTTYDDILQAEMNATRDALASEGIPNHLFSFSRTPTKSLGSFLLYYQLITVILGKLLGVNPYDQPAVEQIKQRTTRYLLNS